MGKTTLCARLEDGTIVRGETNIDIRRVRPDLKILDVFLDPAVRIFSQAREAIKKSNWLVVGPGDLYTSIIPNLLVDGFTKAISESRAKVVYVCNLMTKYGETDGFSAPDFVVEMKRYFKQAGPKLKTVLVNNRISVPVKVKEKYRQEKAFPVKVDRSRLKRLGVEIIEADLAVAGQLWRHDDRKLALVFKKIFF